MWILFALTSATILASRKIQEKRLVGLIGGSLGWMIRIGSSLWAIVAWIFLSRDFHGIMDPLFWEIILYYIIAYPLVTLLYYEAMHHMPFWIFGMLAPIAPVSTIIISHVFLDKPITIAWIWWLTAVCIAIALLAWKKQSGQYETKYLFYTIWAYVLMWLWSTIDSVAVHHINSFLYIATIQTIAWIILFILSYILHGGPKIHLFSENIVPISTIGFIQWIGMILTMLAFASVSNPGYAVAVINTHAIITAIYSMTIMREPITIQKILALIFTMIALVSFAFA